MAAPGQRPVVRESLRKSHADRRPPARRQTDQKGYPRLTRRKRRRKERRQRRNRPVHETEGSGLNVVENERAVCAPEKVSSLRRHPAAPSTPPKRALKIGRAHV